MSQAGASGDTVAVDHLPLRLCLEESQEDGFLLHQSISVSSAIGQKNLQLPNLRVHTAGCRQCSDMHGRQGPQPLLQEA